MLYFETGNATLGKQHFETEMALFPESKHYLTFLLKSAGGNMRQILLTLLLAVLLLAAGCVSTPEGQDYSEFRAADPHSILVLPD